MTDFPVPLDNLIAYVKALHPDRGPLDNVADAMAVSAQLDEQADALIGYFVDQARRSGASWSQIGSSMGVSPSRSLRLTPVTSSPFCTNSSSTFWSPIGVAMVRFHLPDRDMIVPTFQTP